MINKCFRCRKEIKIDNQVYYVFIGKTKTENAEFCTNCYLEDVKEMKIINSAYSHIYAKNFIRMNK